METSEKMDEKEGTISATGENDRVSEPHPKVAERLVRMQSMGSSCRIK